MTPTSPHFRLRAVIEDADGLHGLPPGFNIMPGMPVAVDVKVGRRTVLEYLLGRALAPLAEGMRDPT